MLRTENAFYKNLNLLGHPFLDIKNDELLKLASTQPQTGIYVLTYTEGDSEIPLMVGRATILNEHLNFILAKFRETAKANYKNRFVAESISIQKNTIVLLNLFWFPCSAGDSLENMEIEYTNKLKPIFGCASQRCKCIKSERPFISYERL